MKTLWILIVSLMLCGCENPALFTKRTEWVKVPGQSRPVPVEIIEPSAMAKAIGSSEIFGGIGLAVLSLYATWRNQRTRRELREFAETGETSMWKKRPKQRHEK